MWSRDAAHRRHSNRGAIGWECLEKRLSRGTAIHIPAFGSAVAPPYRSRRGLIAIRTSTGSSAWDQENQNEVQLDGDHCCVLSLPGGVGRYGCCWGTWMVRVLPYMEQGALANLYVNSDGNDASGQRYNGANNLNVTTKRIKSLTCPSDFPNAPTTNVAIVNAPISKAVWLAAGIPSRKICRCTLQSSRGRLTVFGRSFHHV